MQLGKFIKNTPEDLKLISEQMLRNYDANSLPSIIPNTEIHRPDGYWHFLNGVNVKLMSLEVELNQKATAYYESYSSFYNNFPQDHRVLWIVKTKKMAQKIYGTMYEYEPKFIIHNFILLKDFYISGWDSKIFAGIDKDKTILNLFEENVTKLPQNMHKTVVQSFVNDRRITYQYHNEKGKNQSRKKSNCIGILHEKTKQPICPRPLLA